MDKTLQDSLRSFLADEQRRDAALLSAGYQGSAFLYTDNDLQLVIKQAGGGVLTGWFHRMMLRREAHIYALLADVGGVPHSPGLLDERWLVLEFIDGNSLKEKRNTLRDREQFFSHLRTVIAAFHESGVAHGDLKRKDNVLLDADERPYVIDFGMAVTRNGNILDRMLFPLFVRFDQNAWIKAKYRFEVDAISPEDCDWYQPTAVENGFRLIRRFWRTITFRQARNRRRKRRAAEKDSAEN